MPAPAYSLGTELLTAANFSGIETNLVGVTSSTIGNEIKASGLSPDEDILFYVEFIFTPAVDLTDQVVTVFYNGSVRTNAPLSLGLGSGSDNYAVWSQAGNWNPASKDLFTLLSTASPDASAGTFDITAVDRIRMQCTPNRGDSNRAFTIGASFYGAGLTVSAGEPGDQITASKILSYIETVDPDDGTPTYPTIATDFTIRLPFPLIVAAGADIDFSSAIFGANSLTAPDASITAVGPVSYTDQRSGITQSQLSVFGIDLVYDLFLGASSTYTDISVNDVRDTTVPSDTDVQGLINRSTGLISGGDDLDLSIPSSTAATIYEWNGTADLSGSRFNSPVADYCVDFGDAFTSGATFVASALTFVSEPAVKKFRLDAAGKTLNLDVGSSGITAADVEVVAGTLNIVADQVTLLFTGIPSGTNGSIRQGSKILSQQANIVNGTFSYIYDVPGELITYKFTNPGLETIEESLELATVNQSIPLTFVPEESYEA